MDFALNDEQQMLQETARRFFADHHPLIRARQALPWADAAQQQLWADMAGMGFMGLLLPESQDGLGLGMVEACLVAEEAGRQLLTRFNRQLCGEGFYDIPGFIGAVQQAGYTGTYYGVEMISESYRRLPLEVMAQRAFDTTMAQFAALEARKAKQAAQ